MIISDPNPSKVVDTFKEKLERQIAPVIAFRRTDAQPDCDPETASIEAQERNFNQYLHRDRNIGRAHMWTPREDVKPIEDLEGVSPTIEGGIIYYRGHDFVATRLENDTLTEIFGEETFFRGLPREGIKALCEEASLEVVGGKYPGIHRTSSQVGLPMVKKNKPALYQAARILRSGKSHFYIGTDPHGKEALVMSTRAPRGMNYKRIKAIDVLE